MDGGSTTTVSTKKKAKSDPWRKLLRLIGDYAGWSRADEMKGGGDPESYGEIEASLKLAKVKLEGHIARMRRDFDDTH